MSTVDGLVADYLARLENQSLVLPSDRRAELLTEIREHISDARAAGAAADEAAVRTLLDRLGDPGEIIAAAQEDVPVGWGSPGSAAYGPPGWAVPPPAQPARGTGLELAAVLLLTAGSFIPVVGWVVGVVLLWSSSLWRVREKLLGTLVVPFGPGAALFAGALLPFRTQVCTSEGSAVQPFPAEPGLVEESVTCTTSGLPGWAGIPLGLLVLVAPIVVAVVLYRIAQRRAAATPPGPVPAVGPAAAASPWGALEIGAVLVLGLGGFLLPVVGPLPGLVLAWLSPRWTSTQKLVASGLAVLPTLLPLSALLIARTSL